MDTVAAKMPHARLLADEEFGGSPRVLNAAFKVIEGGCIVLLSIGSLESFLTLPYYPQKPAQVLRRKSSQLGSVTEDAKQSESSTEFDPSPLTWRVLVRSLLRTSQALTDRPTFESTRKQQLNGKSHSSSRLMGYNLFLTAKGR